MRKRTVEDAKRAYQEYLDETSEKKPEESNIWLFLTLIGACIFFFVEAILSSIIKALRG